MEWVLRTGADDSLGRNLHFFGRALQVLSKIGDHVYLNPGSELNKLQIRTMNQANSACVTFSFGKEFFRRLRLARLGNADVKISLKSLHQALRALTVTQCQELHVRLVTSGTNRSANEAIAYSHLIWKIKCRNNITKTYNVPIVDDCEHAESIVDKSLVTHKITMASHLLCETITAFHPNLEEMTVHTTPSFVKFRSYEEETPGKPPLYFTEYTVSSSEFLNFEIPNENAVTFCLKEFRSFSAFCEAYGWDMLCSFGTAGDPVIIEVEEAKKDAMVTGRTNIVQHFSAEFVVSTLVGEGLHIPSQPQQQPQQSKQQSRQQSQQPQQQRRQSEQQEPMRSQGRAPSAHVRTVERQPRTREITRETTKSHPSSTTRMPEAKKTVKADDDVYFSDDGDATFASYGFSDDSNEDTPSRVGGNNGDDYCSADEDVLPSTPPRARKRRLDNDYEILD